MAVHAHRERLDAAEHEPGVERARHAAHRVLVVGEVLAELVVGRDEGAADDVTVTTEVLRGRVHDDVCAELDRSLQVRRRERVVDDEPRAGVARDSCDRLDVGDVEQRVGRRLTPDDGGVVADRGAHLGQVLLRDGGVVETPSVEHLRKEPVSPAVCIARDDDVVAGLADGPEDGVLRSEAAREREPSGTAFQRGETRLECGSGRVGAAAVLIPGPKAADAVLLVRRHLVDGRDDGAGERVGLLPRVDGQRLELAHRARLCPRRLGRSRPGPNGVRDTIVTAGQGEGGADLWGRPPRTAQGGVLMSGTALVIVIVIAVLIVIAAVTLAVVQNRRRRALQDRFGPEYDRTIEGTDSKRKAEKDLRERAAQRDQLDIRELTPAAASRYQEQWTLVQQQFVDTPAEAVRDAQKLVTTVMRDRGYPTDDADERESMLSVDHADIVNRYRSATQIERASQAGKATTEDLRQAMQHSRTLFAALLGSSLTTVYADDDDDNAVPSSTGRRGNRVSPDA